MPYRAKQNKKGTFGVQVQCTMLIFFKYWRNTGAWADYQGKQVWRPSEFDTFGKADAVAKYYNTIEANYGYES